MSNSNSNSNRNDNDNDYGAVIESENFDYSKRSEEQFTISIFMKKFILLIAFAVAVLASVSVFNSSYFAVGFSFSFFKK